MGKRMSRAVQERRAPREMEDEDPVRALWRKLEWYATPPWGSRAVAELILRLDPTADSVWDPCCGDGIMAECLKEYFPAVFASDIWPQGYGAKFDFVAPEPKGHALANWIVANPPFALAADFLKRGLALADHGVAILGRLPLLETPERYELFFRSEHPLTIFAPFTERLDIQLGPWNPRCSTATAYAWFLFLKESSEQMKWAARVHPIPPGTKARLSKRGDIRRFCYPGSAPLLEGTNNAEGRRVAG